MLITFRSKHAGDVLMLSEHAAPLLAAAGKTLGTPFPERGIFTQDQLAPAIAGITEAIAQSPAVQEDPDEDALPVHAIAQPVGLKQRAFPLLDMLRKTQAAGGEVSWEAASAW